MIFVHYIFCRQTEGKESVILTLLEFEATEESAEMLLVNRSRSQPVAVLLVKPGVLSAKFVLLDHLKHIANFALEVQVSGRMH